MGKTLLLTAVAACMLSATATAQTKIQLNGATTKVPAAVSSFLQTSVGKNFTANDVMKVYNKGVLKAEAIPSGVKVIPVLTEGFSKLTKGTPEVPDTVELSDSVANLLLPGWGAWHIYQAGGFAYEGYVDTDEGDPGYLMTPDADLSADQGVFRVKMWVKNANPDRTDQLLQYFLLDNNPSKRSIIRAAGLSMSKDSVTECSFISNGGVKNTTVMFFGWGGKVLVDSVSIERLVYPLNTPQNVRINVKNGSTLTATWDAVEGATSYVATLYNRDGIALDSVTTVETTTNSADITGDFNTTEGVNVSVVAKNANGESYPGTGYNETLTVDEVAAPVAKEATNVTENGFTANWDKSDNAHNYTLNLVRTHTVTDGSEQVSYFNDGFSEIPYSQDDPNSTKMDMENGGPVSLDGIINETGWKAYIAACINGMLGITNMYESYGFPSVLYGPTADYSIGGGKATVSGTAFTQVDDAVLKVGFGKFNETTRTATFNEGAKEITIGTTGTQFSEEITGGTADSQLIFQITDAAEGGDMVVFDTLSIAATAQKGDTYTLPYETVTLPYNATSYNVNVPFTGNDKFTYTVTGAFGTTVSAPSNTITVYAPTYNGISTVEAAKANGSKEFYTIDGMKVGNVANQHGLFIVRDGNKTYKIVK